MKQDPLDRKYQKLLRIIRKIGNKGLLICFSGGVDSSLLLAAAKEAAIQPLLALHFIMPTTTKSEQNLAQGIASELGMELLCREVDTLSLPQLANNSRERCYYCKLALFREALDIAAGLKIATVADGSNAEDMNSHRPGNRAAAELGISHPLAEAGFVKAEIREQAKLLGLPNHNQPATPCLASRFPYDTPLTASKLAAVEQGELLLYQLGLRECRLRIHDRLCRIEIPESDFPLLLRHRQPIAQKLRALGFDYVTLDLEGFTSGGWDSTRKGIL